MKTTLLIMAAGIGSRFGTGIKQLEPVDASNHIIMDYSIHDAIEAGFNHVVLELEKRIKICDAQMERMRGILNQNEFDEELVHELIKRIYVGMDNSVEVEFKCSDPYQEVLAIMSEVQNE